MLRFLSSAGVPEEKLAIVGYADRRPIVGNDTEAGRQKNRRVDVVLLRDRAAAAEGKSAPADDAPAAPVDATGPAPAHSAAPESAALR
jgi:chemotaxis protein MotB